VLHKAVEEIKAEIGGLEASEFLQNLEHQAADLGERFMKSAHDVEEATEEVLHEAIGWAKKLSQDLNNLVTGSEHHQEQEEQQQEPTHGSSHLILSLSDSLLSLSDSLLSQMPRKSSKGPIVTA